MNELLRAALRYKDAGIAVIPVDKQKIPVIPTWAEFQGRLPTETELTRMFRNDRRGIAAINGKVSGNHETLDIDNKRAGDAAQNRAAFVELVEADAPGLIARLAEQTTPSGGFHFKYRTDTVLGNQKLAQRPATEEEKQADPDVRAITLIETRGERGYALVEPSPGYHVIRGDFTNPPYITPAEQAILHAAATALNTYCKPSNKVTMPAAPKPTVVGTDGVLPGDDFNARGDIATLITGAGWQKVRDRGTGSDWRRPSKKEKGISATLDIVAPGVFYVFSSNAAPFDNEHGYDPFAVYTLLNHDGDYKAASKALRADGYGTEPDPPRDDEGYALCPNCNRQLEPNKKGDGYHCPRPGEPLCFGWKGEGYTLPAPPDGYTRVGSLLIKNKAQSPGERAVKEMAHQDHTQEIMQQIADMPLTDAGNAESLELLQKDELRYCHDRKKWLAWDGTRWVIDGDGAAERAALAVVRMRRTVASQIEDTDKARKAFVWALSSESEGKRTAMLSTARNLRSLATRVNLYDCNPMVAGVPNGVLDFERGQHRNALREDYITAQLGAEYDPTATCPRWMQFLDEVFAGDTELITYIQRAVGYSLTGDTREHKLFLCFGHGANGKSVFLDVLSRLLGEYAANTSFDTFDAGRRNEATNDLAALKGKRLVTVIETEDDRRLAEARVKQVTGQDKVSCRFLYGEYFEYRPQFKIWMAMNHKPVINGTDNGIWRRIQLIPFTESFLDREDKTLGIKLHAELPGILNWALTGLQAWLSDGLGEARAIEAATREYRRESDLVSQWLEECTERAIDSHLLTSEAIESYTAWCKRNGYRAPTARALGRRLVELGIELGRTGTRRFYFGLSLCATEPTPFGLTVRGAETPSNDVSDVSSSFSGNSPSTFSSREISRKQQDNVTNVTPTQSVQKNTLTAAERLIIDGYLRNAANGDVAALKKARTYIAANASRDWSAHLDTIDRLEAQQKTVLSGGGA